MKTNSNKRGEEKKKKKKKKKPLGALEVRELGSLKVRINETLPDTDHEGAMRDETPEAKERRGHLEL